MLDTLYVKSLSLCNKRSINSPLLYDVVFHFDAIYMTIYYMYVYVEVEVLSQKSEGFKMFAQLVILETAMQLNFV